MAKKPNLPKTKSPSVKPPAQPKERPIRSQYDTREAPTYRDHDDFREWLMRDSR